MQKRKFNWRQFTQLLLPVVIVLVPFAFKNVRVWLPDALQPRQKNYRYSCQDNLKQLGLALTQYAQDNGDKFPPAVIGSTRVKGWDKKALAAAFGQDILSLPVGWADAIQPYVGVVTMGPSIHSNLCPSLSYSSWHGDPTAKGYITYWLNNNLSGKNSAAVAFPTSTLLMGEGDDSVDVTDATYSKSSLPVEWLADQNKPCWRHLGGANYAYADGHAKWLRPNEVTSNFGRRNCFTIR